MRALVLALAACSNASPPLTDGPLPPVDTASPDPDGMPGDGPAALRILVVNEVAAGDTPDWIEVVNATTSPVELSDFIYVDSEGDFAKAKAFPAMTLAPGAYYAQDVDDVISGFKLGSDEAIFVYRASDQALSDSVDWDEGAAPATMSFARSPTVFGDFATGAQSKGTANP
jgi:hypothetical protein